jgi:hypothetical protein
LKKKRPIAEQNRDDENPHHAFVLPRTATFPKGQRLTAERAEKLVIGDDVRPAERDLLMEVLFNREAALAWTFEEMGRVSEEVVPPQKIRTIPHEAWQSKSFPIPKAIRRKVEAKIQERLDAGVYERCEGPYRNQWFVVEKKNGDYRVVNAAMNINRVTIRDATLPPSADEFSERMAGMHVASLIDWFSGYDQIPLHPESRDLTAFSTNLGLLRQTTLPQGATNSVAQFVRASLRILEKMPGSPYIDDVEVDGPKTDYGQAEEPRLPGVRRFMLEHIINLDKVLLAIECAGATIAGEKSQWCMQGVKVVGYVCDKYGRHPEASKVEKVVNWPTPQTPTDVKGFIGLCVYYRIWIKNFALIAGCLYALTKKNAVWNWTREHEEAMDTLKEKLTTAPALITLDYGENAGRIILVFDASPYGWGAILMQEVLYDGKWHRHPSRYESGIWNQAESSYDQVKRECRGFLKALKKFRPWLYGIHFYVESDADTLVAQINGTVTDLPGALVTRWMAWICLFDFEIKHIPGNKNQAADALSRKRIVQRDIDERDAEVDIDDWVDAQLSAARICPVRYDGGTNPGANGDEMPREEENGRILDDTYSDESEEIAVFLTNGMKKNPAHTLSQHRTFRKKALRYVVRGMQLFRRADRAWPLHRRVIDDKEERESAIKAMHDDAGHRGREGTYRRLADRYFWEGMYNEVRRYRESCEECQKRDGQQQKEELKPTWTTRCWQKIGVDIVHMPKHKGKNYLVMARDDLSGWVEARALAKADSLAVAGFLYEDVVCRHGIFEKIVMDGGPENKGLVAALADRYGIRRVVVSAYHPEANGLVERGHKPVVDGLSKMSGGKAHWVNNLHTVLWADRTTVHSSTGMTPYEIMYANRPILPIELEIPTWSVMNWEEAVTRSDLIAMRARVLERREEDMEEAALHLRRIRETNKVAFDDQHDHQLRDTILEKGSLVLRRDNKRDVDMSRREKLSFRWLGPYRVRDVVEDRGTYLLEEMDGTLLRGTFAADALRPFRIRQREQLATDEDAENEGGEGEVLEPDATTSEISANAQLTRPPGRIIINVPPLPAGHENIPRVDEFPAPRRRQRGRPPRRRRFPDAIETHE